MYFALDAQAILHGQIWRIFTFILQPPSTSILFIVFVLYFYYMIGTVLERSWGAFKFNVYFFSGVILHVIAAILIYLIFGYNYHMNTYYINLALFMAFAYEQPDMEVLLFFVLPIKIKWLAWFDGALFAITIIGGYAVTFLPYNIWYGLASVGLLATSVYACYVLATAALVSMLNFIVFMLITRKSKTKNQTQRNFNKAMKTAKRHSRIQTAILTSVFIMPTVKRQHGRMQTDRISQNLWARQSINVRYVAELKKTMRI